MTAPYSAEQIQALLPSFWQASKDGDSILVSECDEPTFRIDDSGIVWVTPADQLQAEFDDSEMAEVWRKEADEVFAKLSVFISSNK